MRGTCVGRGNGGARRRDGEVVGSGERGGVFIAEAFPFEGMLPTDQRRHGAGFAPRLPIGRGQVE